MTDAPRVSRERETKAAARGDSFDGWLSKAFREWRIYKKQEEEELCKFATELLGPKIKPRPKHPAFNDHRSHGIAKDGRRSKKTRKKAAKESASRND
jgi:hypothetical protein